MQAHAAESTVLSTTPGRTSALSFAPRDTVAGAQLARLAALEAEVRATNAFWTPRLRAAGWDSGARLRWDGFHALPFLEKADLVADQERHPPFGSVATYPADRYVAFHQTSGTKGRPLVVLDTQESWSWWLDCWRQVYEAAGVVPGDRVFFAFGFGPFIGFWSAFQAAQRLGALTIPGGGLDTRQRLQLMKDASATVLLSTVTYALRLVEVLREMGQDPASLGIRRTIHAGEPGASIPSVRRQVEDAFGAQCFDHAGATEAGAWGFSCELRDGLHVNEAEFIAEIVDASGAEVADGETGELVLTNLGRGGWPVFRYRTGDLVVRGGCACACGRTFLKLPGGIVGRADDLMILRGVNVYPTSVEAVVREQGFAGEFRMVRTRHAGMEELAVEVEGSEPQARALAGALRRRIGVRIETRALPPGSLPRFELKARRIVDLRDGRREADS
jgi:phenylacetate-CoA ligase